jgi:hypothetical protein
VGSGVIYAVIVVLWAVVLVPLWLRRHDEVTETRSVDRFQGAMRTLSRRDAGGVDSRAVVVPRRYATRAVPDGAGAQISAVEHAAVRRRRIVLALAALTLLLLVLARLHKVPLWTSLLPLLLLLVFVATVSYSRRRAHARELAARRARAAAQRRQRWADAERALLDDGTLDLPRSPAVAEPVRDRPFDQYVTETWVPARTAESAAVPVDPAFYDAVAERVWDPVPVPLPTYVLAPRAPRSVRVIDLTKPGAWTSGHLGEDELLEVDDHTGLPLGARPAGDAPSVPPRDGIVTGEVLVERLRAVGD